MACLSKFLKLSTATEMDSGMLPKSIWARTGWTPDSDNDGRLDGDDDDPLVATPNFCSGDDATIGPDTVIDGQILDCRAQDSITSNSSFVVNSGGEVLFMSQKVILTSGFSVHSGGTFYAVIATEIAN